MHELGALNDYLLPNQKNVNEEQMIQASDSCKGQSEVLIPKLYWFLFIYLFTFELHLQFLLELADEGSRAELHEMLVPALLKELWNDSKNPVHLSTYYLKFTPIPEDRLYKSFGLFVKVPLPEEAEGMELDLHLSHGRSVMTELVPSGVVEFDKDEVGIFLEFFLSGTVYNS